MSEQYAFPCGHPDTTYGPGLTTREFFAALVMAGMTASDEPQVAQAGSKQRAAWAVKEADALIEALEVTP